MNVDSAADEIMEKKEKRKKKEKETRLNMTVMR